VSSTDNAIARFDGTTGNLIQNSSVTIADTGEITSASLTASRALVSGASKEVQASAVTATELGYVSGVTSAIQTQVDGKQATITGGATTITSSNLTVSRALVSDGSGKVAAATTTSTEIGYVNGVTSAIQTQIDGKQATITGGATTITSSNLTDSRALVSDGSGKVGVATTTSTEIGYVNGVTSAIQTQIDAKVTGPGSATDTALARYSGTTGKVVQNSAVTLDANGGMTFTGTTGFLNLPVLTTTQRTALTAANGMMVYDSTLDRFYGYAGGAWVPLHGWGA
jgi:hypothetical protein